MYCLKVVKHVNMCKTFWNVMSQKVQGCSYFHVSSRQIHSRNQSKCSRKMDHDSLCSMFGILDADFLSDAKMLEIIKGARELNLPIIKSNRELVASVNGGLENPSSLVFSSSWNHDHAQDASKRFNYPSLSGIKRPKSDEDIAFMTILELGHLIKSKQITSEELAKIFLDRLKRYGPVLESVITITEELAYEQARRAEQGTLGILRNTPLVRQLDQLPAHQLAWFPFLLVQKPLDPSLSLLLDVVLQHCVQLLELLDERVF